MIIFCISIQNRPQQTTAHVKRTQCFGAIFRLNVRRPGYNQIHKPRFRHSIGQLVFSFCQRPNEYASFVYTLELITGYGCFLVAHCKFSTRLSILFVLIWSISGLLSGFGMNANATNR